MSHTAACGYQRPYAPSAGMSCAAAALCCHECLSITAPPLPPPPRSGRFWFAHTLPRNSPPPHTAPGHSQLPAGLLLLLPPAMALPLCSSKIHPWLPLHTVLHQAPHARRAAAAPLAQAALGTWVLKCWCCQPTPAFPVQHAGLGACFWSPAFTAAVPRYDMAIHSARAIPYKVAVTALS
jgi:hypothetical protein